MGDKDNEQERTNPNNNNDDRKEDTGIKTNPKRNVFFVWMNLIEAVEEITNFDYERVLQMEAIEFFAICTYAFYKIEKQKAELNKFQTLKKY